MTIRIICSFSLLLVASFNLWAQPEERVILQAQQINATGKSSRDFVPRGWKIEQEAKGDLNADGADDLVVQLIEDKPAETSDGGLINRFRALVIAFKNSTGSYDRVAVAGKMLQCTGCGGMLGSEADLSIEKGVLLVSQLSGSREAVNHLRRFRFDAASKQMLLIGEDLEMYDRAIGDSESVSTNYLTGKRTTEKRKYNKKLDRDVSLGKKLTTVPKKRIAIEVVDYE